MITHTKKPTQPKRETSRENDTIIQTQANQFILIMSGV
jgi:hypothetical protein